MPIHRDVPENSISSQNSHFLPLWFKCISSTRSSLTLPIFFPLRQKQKIKFVHSYKYRVYTKECCRFKSSQEIYFSPYTGTTYTVSSGNCPSISCATSSSLLMLTAGQRGQFTRWRRRRKRLSVCSVLRCPDL